MEQHKKAQTHGGFHGYRKEKLSHEKQNCGEWLDLIYSYLIYREMESDQSQMLKNKHQPLNKEGIHKVNFGFNLRISLVVSG